MSTDAEILARPLDYADLDDLASRVHFLWDELRYGQHPTAKQAATVLRRAYDDLCKLREQSA